MNAKNNHKSNELQQQKHVYETQSHHWIASLQNLAPLIVCSSGPVVLEEASENKPLANNTNEKYREAYDLIVFIRVVVLHFV